MVLGDPTLCTYETNNSCIESEVVFVKVHMFILICWIYNFIRSMMIGVAALVACASVYVWEEAIRFRSVLMLSWLHLHN